MRIVVLTKPVPDTTGQERLGPDGRVDRAFPAAVVNGNDEYAVEAALKLVETSPDGGSVTLLAMAPTNAPETLRKALAMGAGAAVLVTDPELEGSCALTTTRVLAATLRKLEFDLVLGGVDSSDGGGGIVAAGVAALLGLPFISWAGSIDVAEARVHVKRITATGFEVAEAPLPALVVATQTLGEPRYPSLKGIMGARSKPVTSWTLADLDLGGALVGGAAATSRLTGTRTPSPRSAARIIQAPPGEAAREIVAFLDERRLI